MIARIPDRRHGAAMCDDDRLTARHGQDRECGLSIALGDLREKRSEHGAPRSPRILLIGAAPRNAKSGEMTPGPEAGAMISLGLLMT